MGSPKFKIALVQRLKVIDSIKLEKEKINFIIEPYIRFQGEIGEQATMFILDPSGNALEFKAFRDVSQQLFAR